MASPISVVPKPSVMPCTLPNSRLTAVMPASTPLATGSTAMPRVRSEPPNAASIRPTMATPPAMARRSTSDLICVRDATAKVPAPDSTSRRPCVSCVVSSLPKLRPTNCSAASCASRSAPSARVVATRIARAALRDTHTPPSTRGACAGSMASAMRRVSPVGSRRSTGLTIAPAGVPSRASVSAMPARKPSTVKRCASTAGLSR